MAPSQEEKIVPMSLADRVQNLTPELFNEVYKLTFTAPQGETRKIDAAMQPPALLQVSQNSRKLFAGSYYGNDSVFEVDLYSAPWWFSTLEKAHVYQIQEVRLTGYIFYHDACDRSTFTAAEQRVRGFFHNQPVHLAALQWQVPYPLRISDVFRWRIIMLSGGRLCWRRWMSGEEFAVMREDGDAVMQAGGPDAFQDWAEKYAETHPELKE